jgi:RecJ-like exonuclease
MAEVSDHENETNEPSFNDVDDPTVPCRQCYGTGTLALGDTCPACCGTGRYMESGPTRVPWTPV